MSVIDEQWTVSANEAHAFVNFGTGGNMTVKHDPGHYSHETATARARLAAQAPAMARLLLAKGIDDTDEYGYRCICCGPSHAEFGAPDTLTGFMHHRDCVLATVLKAAGAL